MNYVLTTLPKRLIAAVASASLLIGGSFLSGCNDAQAGALLGAGIGALAGQAIGGDTEATLIGTAIGAGAGYIIGNESDKESAGYQQGTHEKQPQSRRYIYRKPYSNQRHNSHHEHYHGCGHH